MDKIDVLRDGYVILQDTMGSDLSVVNSARVSYNKKKNELDKKDDGLINFLAREGHTSPFRHAALQFEVYAPLMVARQWWKYITGSTHQQDNMTAWNESSRRYITEDVKIYNPSFNEWREKPENSKQGSGGYIDEVDGTYLSSQLLSYIDQGEIMYKQAMDMGVAPEQARLFLPAYGMYVRWYWTTSLLGVVHFLNERLASDAQMEIQQYAKAIKELTENKFPKSLEALL